MPLLPEPCFPGDLGFAGFAGFAATEVDRDGKPDDNADCFLSESSEDHGGDFGRVGGKPLLHFFPFFPSFF